MPCKNLSFVSVIKAGKITNVMKNTNASPVKNCQAKKKLFFIIIKNATSSERAGFTYSGFVGAEIFTSAGALK
jgi:hypothetical protein